MDRKNIGMAAIIGVGVSCSLAEGIFAGWLIAGGAGAILGAIVAAGILVLSWALVAAGRS